MGISSHASVFVVQFLLINVMITGADIPCAARAIPNRSVVCVCNITYCDEITRDVPPENGYVVYTSSEEGLRFNKSSGISQIIDSNGTCSTIIELYTDRQYQEIVGFGGAITDAAGINWKSLSETLQQYLINSYFGNTGIQYSMLRVPIGGCDFSTHEYTYNELPENDIHLNNYLLTYEDYAYKIPMIKAAMDVSSTPINVIATTWGPPKWMKSPVSPTLNYSSCGRLKLEYYQTYADFHYKFIEQYADNGIPIWGITTTNEPAMMMAPRRGETFNCLGWTSFRMAQWINYYLGPTLKNSKHSNVKIFAHDEERDAIYTWFNPIVEAIPLVLEYIDGIALHFYGDNSAPPSVLTFLSNYYPDKMLLGTEACVGVGGDLPHVDLGSWDRAKRYIDDIITDLNYNMTGWIDWNICLSEFGGPNWINNFADSPVVVFPEEDEFIKQPMFYALGHFSKFIPRGSRRIAADLTGSNNIQNVAFLTPNSTVVLVLYNDADSASVCVNLGQNQVVLDVPSRSISTVEISYS